MESLNLETFRALLDFMLGAVLGTLGTASAFLYTYGKSLAVIRTELDALKEEVRELRRRGE